MELHIGSHDPIPELIPAVVARSALYHMVEVVIDRAAVNRVEEAQRVIRKIVTNGEECKCCSPNVHIFLLRFCLLFVTPSGRRHYEPHGRQSTANRLHSALSGDN